uniref:Uncharacterized protein n=1 Tax=viral metagenome TaxID=1070528 RepID=A0A6M3LCS6_9ZZZZ
MKPMLPQDAFLSLKEDYFPSQIVGVEVECGYDPETGQGGCACALMTPIGTFRGRDLHDCFTLLDRTLHQRAAADRQAGTDHMADVREDR